MPISGGATRLLGVAMTDRRLAQEIVDAIDNPTFGEDATFGDGIDVGFGGTAGAQDALIRWSEADVSNPSFVIGLGDSNQAVHITDKGAVATDWNVSADTHPTVYVHSNTTPATDYLLIGGHDGTTANIDVVGGTTLSLKIAGTENAEVNASGLQVNDDKIVDFGTGNDARALWSTGDASNHSLVLGLGDSNQALHITDKAAQATDWNVSADTHPTVYVHSNTTPATDYVTIGAHDGTTAHINVAGGTTLSLDIAGTAEATVTASGIQLPSGNSLATDTIAETTGAAGVTIDGVLVKDTGIFNADVTVSSTNEINIQIGTVSILALDDAAIAANGAAAATAGKSAFIETQDGGTAAADAVGLAGASLTITAGLGTAGGAHTSNDPDGGASGCISFVVQAGGAAGSGGAGDVGVDGVIRLNGLVVSKQAAPATATTAATLTAAQLLSGLIVATPTAGATAYAVPLGSLLDAAIHADVGADEGFEWSIVNLGADADDIITLTTDTGHTLVGIMAIASSHSSTGLTYGSSARFLTRKTAADTFVTYRIA